MRYILDIWQFGPSNLDPVSTNSEQTVRTQFSKNKCISILQLHDWSSFRTQCETSSNVNDIYDSFAATVQSAVSLSTSESTRSSRKIPRHPWITDGILASSEEKHRLYNMYVKNPSPENKQRYIIYRNKFKSLLRLSKHNHFSKQFQEASNNSKETWKILNVLLNKRHNPGIIKEIIHDGSSYITPIDIVNKLNEYFVNIGKNILSNIKTNTCYTTFLNKMKSPSMSFALWDASKEEILNIILHLKPKQSRGHDDLSMKMLISLGDVLAAPLCDIFNCMLRLASFPDALKTAKVIALFKAGDKTDISNYRPISLLPSISKIFERLIHKRLYNYLSKHNILVPNQYGFRPKHSTTLAVLDLQEKITSALENRQSSIGIFLDLSKAFDSIDHTILLNKLYHYGIRGQALELFKNYLTGRKQYVTANGQISQLANITYGVPQGSILGPLLFIIYINDITTASDYFQFIIFADDTNLFITHKDNDKLFSLANTELNKISVWFKSNKLLLNSKKSSYIHFSYSNNESKAVYIDNEKINQVNETKFLGVTIDKDLKWGPHISKLCKKLSQSIGVIYRLRNELNGKTMLTLYFSIIYTHLTYSNIIWGSADKIHLNKISVLQNRFFRLLKYKINKKNVKTIEIYKLSNCLTFKDIHTLNVCLFMFKLKTNLLPPNCSKYIITYNNTRLMPRTVNNFKHGIARLKCTNNSIKFLGPRVWNAIPDNLKLLSTISSFKKSIRNWLFRGNDSV